MDIIEAYLNTTYVIDDPEYPEYNGIIHLEKHNPHIDEVLGPYESWAFITAWNPESQPLPLEVNQQRNNEIVERIVRFGLCVHSGYGSSKNGGVEWYEEHWFIPGMSSTLAVAIGKYYKQNAILFGEKHKKSALIILNPDLITF
jgi:hypothetical protein